MNKDRIAANHKYKKRRTAYAVAIKKGHHYEENTTEKSKESNILNIDKNSVKIS